MDSSRLVALLRAAGVTDSAARKRLQRATAPVASLRDLRLPGGGRFWHLVQQLGTKEYWRALVAALEDTQSIYGVALNALDAHGGLIPAAQFSIVSGAPQRGAGHVVLPEVKRTLEDLGLMEECKDPELGACLRLASVSGFRVAEVRERRAARLAERVLLEAFKEWTRKLGLVSYEKVRLRGDDEVPVFGPYGFDYSAPSYVHPLGDAPAARCGFLVADVVLRDGVTLKQCEYFLRKAKELARNNCLISTFA
ncbi:MAG TPA: hypothetical protein VHQ90_16530 [Thermoanaerobaculia bacterium]|nr:hypothetical protein [Thermoanaerobaculia bacterium]